MIKAKKIYYKIQNVGIGNLYITSCPANTPGESKRVGNICQEQCNEYFVGINTEEKYVICSHLGNFKEGKNV